MNAPAAQDTHTVAASDGIALHAQATGRGEPIVFVHEFSGNHRSWDAQTAFFRRYARCIVFNARGYPPSEVPHDAAAYDQGRAADDVADVIRALANGPAHVVGLSMGGFAALHLALRQPELVKSLVVAGCGYGAKPEQQPDYGDRMRAEADHAQAIGIAAFARELAESPYAACLRAKDPQGWKTFAEQLAEQSAEGMAMTLRAVLAKRPSLWHLEARLRAMHVPTLLLAGDEDGPCLEPSLYLMRTIPDAALCVLPRTGHLANLEEPALFNDTIFRFITAVNSGRWSEWTGRSGGL
jgi:pimeloyl-ACP methyl ester carboxylesterase